MVILLPSAESFMKGCCQLQAKVCARLLVNCLFKLAQEKNVVRWTDRPAMTIAVDLGRKATNKSTSRYLDDLLNIDNPYFEQMVGQIYPTELQLNKANSSDTEAPFLDMNLSITNGIVSSNIYDKRDDFNFEIVNFPFLDGDVPRSPSYGVYISQLICFARVCSNVDDFNNRNLF